MRQSTAGFLLSGLLLLTVVGLMSGQTASQNPRWEYAAYEVAREFQGNPRTVFYWHSRKGSVQAEGERFRQHGQFNRGVR